jgi:dUTPase
MDTFDRPDFKFALREDLKDQKQFLPTKATELASGYDVRAAFKNKKDLVVKCGEYVKIPLGIRAFSPEGWWLQLHPRSSTFAKKNIHSLIGIIDCDYSGEIHYCGQLVCDVNQISMNKLVIKYGEPIGQLLPMRLEPMVVSDLSNEEFDALVENRKTLSSRQVGDAGGFGSTSGK